MTYLMPLGIGIFWLVLPFLGMILGWWLANRAGVGRWSWDLSLTVFLYYWSTQLGILFVLAWTEQLNVTGARLGTLFLTGAGGWLVYRLAGTGSTPVLQTASTQTGAAGSIQSDRNRHLVWLMWSMWWISLVVGWKTWRTLLLAWHGPVLPVSDAPIYHLPFALQWWQTGRLEYIPTPFGETSACYFPLHGDLWLLWQLLLADNLDLAKIGQVPFVGFAGATLYYLGRLVTQQPLAALGPVLFWIGTPLVQIEMERANIDLLACTAILLAVVFAWHCLWKASATAHDWFCFGLASGLAIGCKSIALVFLSPLWLILSGQFWLDRLLWPSGRAFCCLPSTAPTRPLSWWFLFLLGLSLTGVPWYWRNWWVTGNPLFPLEVTLGSWTIFAGGLTRAAMLLSAYHHPTDDGLFFIERLSVVLELRRFLSLVLSLVVGLVVGIVYWRRHTDQQGKILFLNVLYGLFLVGCYWFVIPYNTQERFLLPALALLSLPMAWLFERWPVCSVLLAGWLTWISITAHYYVQRIPIDTGNNVRFAWKLQSVPSGLFGVRGDWPDLLVPMLLLAVLFLPLGNWTAVWQWRSSRHWWRVIGAVLVLGYSSTIWSSQWWPIWQANPMWRFYPQSGFAQELYPAWQILEQQRQRASRPLRVAYAGTNLPYYLFGADLQNRVTYFSLNENKLSPEQPASLLHDHLPIVKPALVPDTTTPFLQWERLAPHYSAWLNRLRAADIDLLFVARENQHGKPLAELESAKSPAFPIEQQWAESHPEHFLWLGPFPVPGQPAPRVKVYQLRPEAALLKE